MNGGEVFVNSKQRTNYATDWSNIQPRFGFAYQVAPATVLRGGYGIYYGQSRSGVTGVVPYGAQGFNQFTNVITTYQSDGRHSLLAPERPVPQRIDPAPGNSLGLLNDVGFGANGPLRTGAGNRTPNEQSWSFGFEHQLPGIVVLNAEYIGKKGTHLPFSGYNQLNHLGSWVESLPINGADPNQPCLTLTVSCLNSFVDNPFAGIDQRPQQRLSSPTVQNSSCCFPILSSPAVSTTFISSRIPRITRCNCSPKSGTPTACSFS